MSACISKHGEFSSHDLDALHTCTMCGVLDEDALRAELASPDGPDLPDGGDKQSKYTVMLTPRSVAALKEAASVNHETRTNVLNRGVQLYLLITRLINGGWTIIARDKEGREQQIQIL